jgi:hypothetical protein
MGKLQDQRKMDMELKNFSLRTVQTYLGRAKSFAAHYGKSPEDMGPNEIRDYLYYLLKERKASQSGINQAYNALKFLYQTTLGREWDSFRIPRGTTAITESGNSPQEVWKKIQRHCGNRWCSSGHGLQMV